MSPMSDAPRLDDFGPNAGLVEELYRQWRDDPSSVAESWRDFFEDYQPRTQPPGAPPPGPEAKPAAPEAPPSTSGAPAVDGARPLRGPAALIARNMETSLGVPTATSARVVPARLLEVNRRVANNYLTRMQRTGKVSFTHLIGWAVVRALGRMPVMNSAYASTAEGKPGVVRHEHVNLGLAVDVARPDGSHSLVVPNIKAADQLDFAAYLAAYEDVIRRVRSGKLTADDFAGTTVTLTNPGTIGTVHSVPRLMAGQGAIVGVGTIDYPAEYHGADPRTIARLGVGKVVTLTSTYDHRVIQGAESGEFLGVVHGLLTGSDDFYDDVFRSLRVPYEPVRWKVDSSPDAADDEVDKAARVLQLINIYRVRGHLIADLDPLGRKDAHTPVELDPAHYGLTIWDLERSFATGGLAGSRVMPLADILGVLRDAYSRTVGVEYMHISDPEQKAWIQARVEGARVDVGADEKRRILERLNAAEAFERFLHTKYLGHKRYGLEGAESLIPLLDALLNAAGGAGVEETVLGMAHRGRLNVLANIVGKSYGQIFREFDGNLDPASAQGSGDVKYHLGARGVHTTPDGDEVGLTLAPNPSHLEAVDPVVEGMARAAQDRRGDTEHTWVAALLIHGDAAFAGQGVVAETFNLSALPGYRVGGTVHVVVNNQLGFTTTAELGRSSLYATDIAKMVQAPIFHVNGDDPEACARVARLAFDFKAAFQRDVVIDMVCYRRFGHNEADEPAYTQPRMYALIEGRRSVRKLYTESLVNRGDITVEEAEEALADFQGRLEGAFAETREAAGAGAAEGGLNGPSRAEDAEPAVGLDVATCVSREDLAVVVDALSSVPDGFELHPKLVRHVEGRRTSFEAGTVDWALAESLAFGSLVAEGVPVRLAGQDSRRGTFSQRHAVLVDYRTENEHVPLSVLGRGRAPFRIYDSLLSEYAAMGFDYGYSVAHPEALVCWEAQFGDFVNGGQIILDQFVVAADDKWGAASGLVLLLPHGFEGQGPEHSSARLERFLSSCAEENIRVAYPSTAAQYFHLLRRQALARPRRPLVVMTPKRYLRMPASRSGVDELISGRFCLVLGDPAPPDEVRRVVLCTGKVGHELLERRDKAEAPALVVRLEQLYPFPAAEVRAVVEAHPGAALLWAQEEPENMGAWRYVRGRLRWLLGEATPVAYAGRVESGSPASGSGPAHEAEQEELLQRALSF